jgi:P4 family phage/plasmid primase-like protien
MDPPSNTNARKSLYLDEDDAFHRYSREISFIADYEESQLFIETVRKNLCFYLDCILDPSCNLSEYELYDVYRALTRYKDYKDEAAAIRKRIQSFIMNNDLLGSEMEHHLTIRTIEWYARKKSADYLGVYNQQRMELIKESLRDYNDSSKWTPSDISILKYFFYVLHLFFSYDSSSKTLYFYSEKDNKWVTDFDCTKLSSQLLKEIRNLSDELRNKIEELDTSIQGKDPSSKEVQDATTQKNMFRALITVINKIQFLKKMKISIIDFFAINNLQFKLDSNPSLTGTSNGVIEVIGKNIIFRNGKPEDYITRSTGIFLINDPPEKVSNDRYMIKLTNWLHKVFIDEDLLEYFIRVCSSLLYRKNREKLFFIMTGSGDNSKSAIKKLIENTLGEYSFTLPNNFLAKKDKLGHKTELHSTKYRSVCFIQENDVTDILISGKIKELTGNDTVYSRELFQKGENQSINFKCFLMCNEVPCFTNVDAAIKRRIVIIPFNSKWSSTPPETKDERYTRRIFKLKVDFEDNIPKMAPYFLYVLFHNYREYEKNGIGFNKCEYISKFMAAFWEENDPYLIFKRQYIKEEEGQNMRLDTLVTKFRDWMTDVFRDSRASINRTTIKNGFENILGKCEKGVFVNYRCTYNRKFEDIIS